MENRKFKRYILPIIFPIGYPRLRYDKLNVNESRKAKVALKAHQAMFACVSVCSYY